MATKRQPQILPLPARASHVHGRRAQFPGQRLIVLSPGDLASIEPEIDRETNVVHWITSKDLKPNVPRFTRLGTPAAKVIALVRRIMREHETSKILVEASRRLTIVFLEADSIALVHFIPSDPG